MESKVVWREGMAFDAHIEGFTFVIDASLEAGGQDLGPRPKALTLTSLAGCTAMDVISILGKMQQHVTAFSVEADGELANEHPRSITSIVVRYRIEGENLDPGRVRRAVELSETRYCGVSATLRPGVALSSEIWVNGQKLD